MSALACPECGNTNRGHIWGIEVQGVYDGVAYWTCAACGCRWHRFPEGDPRRDRVQAMLNAAVSSDPLPEGERP